MLQGRKMSCPGTCRGPSDGPPSEGAWLCPGHPWRASQSKGKASLFKDTCSIGRMGALGVEGLSNFIGGWGVPLLFQGQVGIYWELATLGPFLSAWGLSGHEGEWLLVLQ